MIELLTNEEMAEADRLTIAAGTPGITLMENAGRAVADRVAAFGLRRILVVCGPGNNGGDGFVAARLLTERGFLVRLMLAGEVSRLKGDAATAAERWKGPVERAEPSAVGNTQIIIDALLGAGAARPVEGVLLAIINAINGAEVPVVAVDLPSGINGTTGRIWGTAAVQATETVTFFRRKPGHLLLPGRLHCGKTIIADIGIPAAVLGQINPRAFADEPALWQDKFPKPRIDGHKYDRGHAVVVSGELPSTGAAKLAARGALRVGAGLVTIASPQSALVAHAAESVAIMVKSVSTPAELGEFLTDHRRNSVVLGPGSGVGQPTREKVLVALKSEAAIVLDADAISSFAGERQALVNAIKGRGAPVVLTPHDGEFSRLFKDINEDNDVKSKLEKTRTASGASGAFVVLKGPDTVIAAPDGRAAISGNAPATLATAGSGDVLAGMIGGLLAQGLPPFEAAAAAVWLHGEAATAFGTGLIAEDLPDSLPAILKRL